VNHKYIYRVQAKHRNSYRIKLLAYSLIMTFIVSLEATIGQATGRKKWDLSHFPLTTRFLLLYVGIGMFVHKSYRHMIGLDDVAPKIAASPGWKQHNDDVTVHHPSF
jgi:hypothetical protein